jgi:CheY-like chemotaxis protein
MQKKYILLIDDDPDEFDFFLTAVNKIPGHFECSFAVNDREALAMLGDHHADYIFVDMNMPAVNGLECVSHLIAEPHVNEVPIYLYTTLPDMRLRSQAEHAGACGCIKKPSSAAGLSEILRLLYETGSPEPMRKRNR